MYSERGGDCTLVARPFNPLSDPSIDAPQVQASSILSIRDEVNAYILSSKKAKLFQSPEDISTAARYCVVRQTL
jgi:hypothetical protein